MNNETPVQFNPELFLNTTVDAVLSTEYVNLPVGDYVGVIGPIGPDNFKSFDIKRGENAGKKAYRLDLEILIDDPEGKLREELGGRPPKVFDGIMLDLKADGSLEFGKGRNVQLGKLRDALGQNKAGPWSFGMMASQPVKVSIVHDTYDGKTSAKVKAYGKAFG